MHPPGDGWDGRMPREKRNWWFFFWGFTILTSLIALAWFYVAPDHEIPMKQEATSPAEFHAEVAAFVKQYETTPGSGIVAVPPGQDAYLEGRMWQWYPILQLKAGQKYTIWLSSVDVTHALVIGEQHLIFDAVPGHKFGITLTPDKPGTYLIYCAEFCGLGHQNMASRIIVTP
jgi:cytochrome c oxidase subunit II